MQPFCFILFLEEPLGLREGQSSAVQLDGMNRELLIFYYSPQNGIGEKDV